MPSLLTTNAIITCPHGGVGTTVPSNPIVSVAGGYVCCEGDVGTLSCAFPVPCAGYTLKSMGLNATLINGMRAVLSTDFQQSLTGLPLTISDPNFAIDSSSVASLPPDTSDPQVPVELQDEIAPTVIAVPPVAAFSIVTMMPPSMPVVFTLTHPFPLSWQLTLQNGTLLTSVDVTNGFPGLIVAPSGGDWSSPVLPVSVTMTAAFMAALTPGLHTLYMTGISKRGIQAHGKVDITVS